MGFDREERNENLQDKIDIMNIATSRIPMAATGDDMIDIKHFDPLILKPT